MFLQVFSVSAQQSIYVDASSQTQPPSGTIQAPFQTLNTALSSASSGDSIFVAGGVYSEIIHLNDNKGVIMMGGFSPINFSERNPETYPTRIRGGADFAVIHIEYSGGPDDSQRYHFDGFIIENGQRGILAQNYLSGGWPELVISNNIIRNNGGLTGSNDYGGGVASASMLLELRNNLIQNNTSGKSAGFSVQLNNADYQVLIENNIVENNAIYSDHGAGAGVQIYKGIIRNGIFWDNASSDNSIDFYIDATSSLHINYSIYQTGYVGTGNFQMSNSFIADPLFADAEGGFFQLQSTTGRWSPDTEEWVIDGETSPGIDAGDPTSPFDNEPTPNGGRVNLGVYGNTHQASLSSISTTLPFKEAPESAQLFYAYPNPFNPVTTINYGLPEFARVRLEVYNVLGQRVATLVNSEQAAGYHSVQFDGQRLASGVYIYRLQTGENVFTRKMVLVK